VPRPLLIPILLTLAFTACSRGSRPAHIGTAAPDFTVKDADSTVTLSRLRGQIIVLNFWATWCPPCVEEMPSLVSMAARLKGKGVTVLGVSIDADPNAYHKFLKNYGVNFLTVRDPEQRTPALYGTHMWPETYIIDRHGVLRRKFIGPMDWNSPEIVDYLNKLSS